MAIELLKRVTVVSPKETNKRLVKAINNLGMMEIIDVKGSLEEDVPLRSYEVPTEEEDNSLYKIDFILNLMNIFSPEQESFIKSLTPLPLVTSREEIDTVISEYSLEDNYLYASELDGIYRRSERVINEIENEMKELGPIADIPFDLAEFFSPTRVGMVIGYVPEKNIIQLNPATEPWTEVAWERDTFNAAEKQTNERVRMLFAFLKNDAEDIRKALSDIGFDEIQLPKRR